MGADDTPTSGAVGISLRGLLGEHGGLSADAAGGNGGHRDAGDAAGEGVVVETPHDVTGDESDDPVLAPQARPCEVCDVGGCCPA
jgi:hypothetical protein